MAARAEFGVEVLGGFRVHLGERLLVLRPSCRRLVALLSVTGPQLRVDAAATLWPDLPAARAASNLRTAVWRLRQDVEGLVLGEGGLLRTADVAGDLAEVREWARCTLSGDQLAPTPRHAARELLPGWGDAWLVEPREELRLLQLHALEASAQRLLQAGRLAEACRSALGAVMMDPLRESATRLLIEIQVREGNTADALRSFRRFRQLLDRELDAGPSPAITALVAPLVRPHPSATAGAGSARGR